MYVVNVMKNNNLPPELLEKLIKSLPNQELVKHDFLYTQQQIGFNEMRTKTITALPDIIAAYNKWLLKEIKKMYPKHGIAPDEWISGYIASVDDIITFISNQTK